MKTDHVYLTNGSCGRLICDWLGVCVCVWFQKTWVCVCYISLGTKEICLYCAGPKVLLSVQAFVPDVTTVQ